MHEDSPDVSLTDTVYKWSLEEEEQQQQSEILISAKHFWAQILYILFQKYECFFLFNGISTLFRLFNAEAILLEVH